MVAHRNQLIKVSPGSVGGQAFETRTLHGVQNITALAYDSYTETIFYADAQKREREDGLTSHTGTIGFLSLKDMTRLVGRYGWLVGIAWLVMVIW